MNWQWTSIGYAVSGALAGLVPIAFHLLRQRHVHRIEWGPMHLLRQAVTRQRRWLRLRDRLLLTLRMLAIVAFGCALARPRHAVNGRPVETEPGMHLLLIDNSLSMAFQHLGATRQERARQKAREILDRLSPGARAVAVAVCGPLSEDDPLEWRLPSDVRLDGDAIKLVEQPARLPQLTSRIESALAYLSPPPQRIYLITDQQASNWSDVQGHGFSQKWPPIEIVDVGAGDAANAWIQSVRTSPPVLIVGQPLTVHVQLGAAGSGLARRTAVSLLVEGVQVASRTVDTPSSGQIRSLEFEIPAARLPEQPPGDEALAVTVEISEDLLPQDDRQQILIPLLRSPAVVCVDALSDREETEEEGRVGSTYFLRRLLAAFGSPAASHVTLENLDEGLLEQSRAVVLAGISSPGNAVSRLRKYVAQGGQLLIAAGGSFDPQAWHDGAWRSGQGVLPLPLPQARGVNALDVPQRLDWESMQPDSRFHLPGLSSSDLVALAHEPLILRVVSVVENDRGRGEVDGAASAPSDLDEVRVVCRLENGIPVIIERSIGRGHVVLLATSLEPSWNTWGTSNAVLFWKGLLDGMIQRTIPPRLFRIGDPLRIMVSEEQATDAEEREWSLQSPTGVRKVSLSGISDTGRHTVVEAPPGWQRGIYRLIGSRSAGGESSFRVAVLPSDTLPAESDLTRIQPSEIKLRSRQTSASGAAVVQASLSDDWVWWYLVVLALGLLALEMIVLGAKRRSETDSLQLDRHLRPVSEEGP